MNENGFESFERAVRVEPDVVSLLSELEEIIAVRFPLDRDGTRADMCEFVSSEVKTFFQKRGIPCDILEGEVTVGEKNHLVHRLNLIRSGTSAWVIDLSSKQIPLLKDKPWIMQELPNEPTAIRSFLESTYRWWFPKS